MYLGSRRFWGKCWTSATELQFVCIESMCNIMDIMNKPVQCQFKATRRTSRRTFQIVLLRTLKESTTQTVKSFKNCWICTVLVFEPLPFPWGSAGLFLLSKLDLPQPRATWSAAKRLKSPITLGIPSSATHDSSYSPWREFLLSETPWYQKVLVRVTRLGMGSRR